MYTLVICNALVHNRAPKAELYPQEDYMSGPTSVLQTELPSAARKENDETLQALSDMIAQFAEMVDQIEFPTTAFGPAGGELAQDVLCEVRDVNDKRMIFGENVVKRIQVDVTGNAANGAVLDADGNPVTTLIQAFAKGQTTFQAIATGTGTVILTMTDVDSSGLTIGGAATVTFS